MYKCIIGWNFEAFPPQYLQGNILTLFRFFMKFFFKNLWMIIGFYMRSNWSLRPCLSDAPGTCVTFTAPHPHPAGRRYQNWKRITRPPPGHHLVSRRKLQKRPEYRRIAPETCSPYFVWWISCLAAAERICANSLVTLLRCMKLIFIPSLQTWQTAAVSVCKASDETETIN